MNNKTLSRRDIIQALTFAGAGLGLTQLISCSPHIFPARLKVSHNQLSPFYLPPSEPLQMPERGIMIKPLVRSSQTNVQYSCIEFAIAPKQMEPEPHFHDALDELMFVQEGTMSVLVGEKAEEIQAGGWHSDDFQIPPLRCVEFGGQ